MIASSSPVCFLIEHQYVDCLQKQDGSRLRWPHWRGVTFDEDVFELQISAFMLTNAVTAMCELTLLLVLSTDDTVPI